MLQLLTWLPHLSAALLTAVIALLISSRYLTGSVHRGLVFAATFTLCLVPLPIYPLTHYIRVIVGDLSVVTVMTLVLIAAERLRSMPLLAQQEKLNIAALVVGVCLVLYPTALGFTTFDLYARGYYPIILAPALLALFGYCLLSSRYWAAALLAAGFAGYALGILDSDNLWDYLVDPVLLCYAGTLLIRHRRELNFSRPAQQDIERFMLMVVASFLLFAVYLSRANPDAFRYEFTIEDGFIEWCTVLVLLTTMVVCGRRFILLRGHRSRLFLSVTALLTLLCLFGAGEEISWGQRIFGLETPEYLQERNAQGEIGLHNLVVEINGEEVKLNKLIFGTGLALSLLIYLFVATPLYRTKAPVTRFFDAIAAPMPRNYHIIGYLAVVATVELLVDSSKRGEMTEFAGSIIFALNVIYPDNAELFKLESGKTEQAST
ncbi:MAG: hypothetical protein O3B72_09865 [Proteobacteria bacterium]|nr:hypothetical protein [Pseudomonadota bacterium]